MILPEPDDPQDTTSCVLEGPLPGELGSRHLEWQVAPKVPVLSSADPSIQRLVAAANALAKVEFFYFGGSEPGRRRCATLSLVFRVPGFPGLYAAGYCHLRHQERVFHVERMVLIELEE
jgi:predicted DNA-binding transcriptional regulator YafY